MKNRSITQIMAVMAAIMTLSAGCTELIIIEVPYTACTTPPSDNGGNNSDNTGENGLGSNLITFHASVESLNIATKSMSPISAGTKVMVYAYHGSTSDAVSTSAVARGSYTAQQTGTLTGDSGYKMSVSNGTFDFYAVSANSTDSPPVFTNGVSSALQNGVDYLWWGCANYEINSPQVSVPIVFNHSATQVVFEIAAGSGIALQQVVSATITPPQTGATMDLTTGIITPATEYGTVPASMGINGLTLQYTMLPLQTTSPMTLDMSLNLNYDPTPHQYSVKVPIPDGGLQAGNSYLFRAIIDADTVTFPSVEVTDWVTVDETGNPLYPH